MTDTNAGLLERNGARRDKTIAAGTSVLAAALLLTLKLIVGLLTGSLGILAEAAHSGLDLVAAFITLLAVRAADRPADADHMYGHGKIENLSALIETGLLFLTCAWIVYEAVRRLFFASVEIEPSAWAFAVMGISIAVDVNRSRLLSRTARRHASQALEADALHFSTDVWSSAVVILGLGLVLLGRSVWPARARLLAHADALAALAVAFIVLFVSYRLGRRTIDVLLDRAPEGLSRRIRWAAAAAPAVLEVRQVRVRGSGPHVFVDLTIEVDRNLAFERVHAVAEDVEARVRAVSPGADVVVHTDPREAERESVARRVRAIADRNQLAVHNIGVHRAGSDLHVDLHLEVDDHLSLGEAHDLARHVEGDLQAGLPSVARVDVHIEARGSGVGEGVDVTDGNPGLVRTIIEVTDRVAGPGRCHSVLLRRRAGRLLASLHCFMPADLPVTEAHEISTRIEAALQASVPELERVVVHAEPTAQED